MAAERVGAVSIRYGKRERSHLIERVTVKDPAVLASHLGRKPASSGAGEARARLLPIAARGASWVPSVLDDIVVRWARATPAFRLAPLAVDAAGEFLSLLAAISNEEARGLDGRTFSFRIAGDTKVFDRHAARIATVLASQFGEPTMPAEEVWSRIGLERFAHPVHIKGCVVATDAAGILVDGRATPFASFHSELQPLIRLSGRPSAVLTIENYASFNRYVREIDEGTLVLYTGGFASLGVIELLKTILEKIGPEVPFFHRGDIDPGGLRIFRFLEETLPRAPIPFRMDQTLAETHGRPAARDPTLGAIAKSNSALAALAAWLSQGEEIRHLEQEALDPVSPLTNQ